MNDFLEDVKVEEDYFDGSNIYDESVDPVVVKDMLWTFQVPNPFPKVFLKM